MRGGRRRTRVGEWPPRPGRAFGRCDVLDPSRPYPCRARRTARSSASAAPPTGSAPRSGRRAAADTDAGRFVRGAAPDDRRTAGSQLATYSGGDVATLHGVSCTSATFCLAVGWATAFPDGEPAAAAYLGRTRLVRRDAPPRPPRPRSRSTPGAARRCPASSSVTRERPRRLLRGRGRARRSSIPRRRTSAGAHRRDLPVRVHRRRAGPGTGVDRVLHRQLDGPPRPRPRPARSSNELLATSCVSADVVHGASATSSRPDRRSGTPSPRCWDGTRWAPVPCRPRRMPSPVWPPCRARRRTFCVARRSRPAACSPSSRCGTARPGRAANVPDAGAVLAASCVEETACVLDGDVPGVVGLGREHLAPGPPGRCGLDARPGRHRLRRARRLHRGRHPFRTLAVLPAGARRALGRERVVGRCTRRAARPSTSPALTGVLRADRHPASRSARSAPARATGLVLRRDAADLVAHRGRDPDGALAGVSCATARRCVAVGARPVRAVDASSGDTRPRRHGPRPLPGAFRGPDLAGVDCVRGACRAVGQLRRARS